MLVLDLPITHAERTHQFVAVGASNVARDCCRIKGGRPHDRPYGVNEREAELHREGQLRLVEILSRLLLQESLPSELSLLAHLIDLSCPGLIGRLFLPSRCASHCVESLMCERVAATVGSTATLGEKPD